VAVDLGQPLRVLNLFHYPSPRSLLFWDTVALLGYLLLNIVIGVKTLAAERNQVAPPRWVRLLILVSIPWAVSIHTVTAFLYCGLSARPFWFTAVLTPRFLASAFASGPALLIILCSIVRRVAGFDPGERAIKTLARIVTYALSINLFLFGSELFTTIYSGQEHHILHLQFLYTRVDGILSPVAPFMWASLVMAVAALILLLSPVSRTRGPALVTACILVFVSIWIDKGAGLLSGGFTPTPLGRYAPYFPSIVEILMGIGLYAFGALILTFLYKMAITIKSASEFNVNSSL
jgi:molybdopterin-containing oxidoreductase family membrane subunit